MVIAKTAATADTNIMVCLRESAALKGPASGPQEQRRQWGGALAVAVSRPGPGCVRQPVDHNLLVALLVCGSCYSGPKACFFCPGGSLIDRLQRTEERRTDAPREAGCLSWVVLGVKAIEAPGVRAR